MPNFVFPQAVNLISFTVFNQKTLYNAYKKRTKNIEVDLEEYNRMKEADPEFYREASSLQYGKVSTSIFQPCPLLLRGFPEAILMLL